MIQVYDKYGKIKTSGTPGSGTITSFSAGDLSPIFTSTVTSPTSTPNLSFSAISQAQNLFYASPNGSSGLPTFRALVAADIPTLTGYVPTSRTLTINGVTYDLSSDRSWTVTASGATWGSITGTLTAQTDLTLYLSTNYFPIPTGTVSQYIRGDGSLATLPSSASGGSAVSYYLNGGTPASVVSYYQMSKTAVIGTGVDFSLAGNGLISQWLTDVGDPNRLEILAGNWNFEIFMSASSSGGTPAFYVELLKYNGITFTSIANSSAVPENIVGGTSIDLYLTSLAIPLTTLLVTDRLAVRVYIVNSIPGRTITMYTQDSHLCQIITNFPGGISALNGLTSNTQYFGNDTNVTMVSSGSTHTLTWAGTLSDSRIASASVWNAKGDGTVTSVAALTLGTTGTDLTSTVATGTTTPVITLNVPTASATNRGALSSTDWTTFNNKQNTSTLILDSVQKAIIRDNYFWFVPNTLSTGVSAAFGYSERIMANTFQVVGNGTLLRGLTPFSTTAVAGTIAYMKRNDAMILTGLEAVITRKIQFNSNVSGQRFYCGLAKGYQFVVPTNVEPSNLTDIVGVCQLSSSTNMHVVHNDAAGTGTTIDLGSSYPCNDLQYNYFITIEQTTTSYIITVERVTIATGASISTTNTLSTNIPVYNTGTIQLLTWISNNATATIASYLDGGGIGNIKNQ